MARTIKQIQDAIISAKNADANLAGLTSASSTAIWLLWTYVIAFSQWTLEVLFDTHKSEVKDIIVAGKVHTRQWYVTKAKQFQYTVMLPRDTDVYPTITPSALIVTKAAAEEVATSGTGSILRIKVAKGSSPLTSLLSDELNGLNYYFSRIKDAGVRLQATSGPPDTLQLSVSVFYDPMVLNNAGGRLDGTTPTPVQDAINDYLQDMGNSNFNGALVLNKLMNVVLGVEGIVIFTIRSAQAYYGTMAPVVFASEYKPDAGYLANDVAWFNTNVIWTEHEPI